MCGEGESCPKITDDLIPAMKGKVGSVGSAPWCPWNFWLNKAEPRGLWGQPVQGALGPLENQRDEERGKIMFRMKSFPPPPPEISGKGVGS